MQTQQAARDAVARMVEQAQDRARQAEVMVQELDALRVVGRSRDGVEVVLGHTGGLLEVTLGDRLDRATTREIEASIKQANADAQFQLQAQVGGLAERHYGAGSATTLDFTARYQQLFPQAEATDEDGDQRGGRR